MGQQFTILFLTLFWSLKSFAISEINYKENYQNKIIPFIKTMREGTFIGENNIPIHYMTFINNKAKNCLVILPGRTEPALKYAEVVFDLKETNAGKNLNFYLLDHRGQGLSGRMATPSDLGHVDSFKNYVLDLENFIANQNLHQNCEHKYLLAHSLGAGIAIAYLLKYPDTFERVALSSPMLKIQTHPYPDSVAQAIVDLAIIAGFGEKFSIGQKGFDPNFIFSDNQFTTSPERFAMTFAIFKNNPQMQVGGVSNRWILEVMKGTQGLRSNYHELLMPMRVFNAGIESYSEPNEMVKLCSEAPNCKRIFLPTSKHEVLMDRDINRDMVIAELNNFFLM